MASTGFAAPNQMGYSGRLYDTSSGTPVTDTLDITFRIFTTQTGTTPLFEETQTSVSVDDGYFFALINGVEQMSAFGDIFLLNDELYLEIQVGSSVLTPRQPLAAMPWALGDQSGELTLPDCADNQVLKYSSGGWDCATDEIGSGSGGVSSLAAGDGIDVSGATGDVTVSAVFSGNGSAATVAHSDHNHTGVYAPNAHDHDGRYSLIGHDHDGDYAPYAHEHSGADITSGTVSIDRLPVGTGAGQVAPGIHVHDYLPTSGGTIYNNTLATSLAINNNYQHAGLSRTIEAECRNNTGNSTALDGEAWGTTPGTNIGVKAAARNGAVNYGLWAEAPNGANDRAGYFSGDVEITGDLRVVQNIEGARNSCVWTKMTLPNTLTVTAVCPAGKYVMTGGCDSSSSTAIRRSMPAPAPDAGDGFDQVTGWTCTYEVLGASILHTAYALCCGN